MFTKSATKWLFSFILAGVLLALALFGGTWGTTYAAEEQVNLLPQINYIVPNQIEAGSPDTIVFVSGSGFGNANDTAVRIQGDGVNKVLYGFVQSNGIWVTISAADLANPVVYSVTVLMSLPHTLPTVPTVPPYDVESNSVPLRVYINQLFQLPVLYK